MFTQRDERSVKLHDSFSLVAPLGDPALLHAPAV